jgi:ATP/maltotriose-dependent transcriptional regulator MalT
MKKEMGLIGGGFHHVYSSTLYKHPKHFDWAKNQIKDITFYLDETILRQTKNFRNIFYRLAEQLVREGKKDSAIKALDYCQKVLPSKTIAHDVFSVRLAEGYFLAGSADKANALLREILNTCETKAKYYKTFRSSSKYKLVKPELEENIQIMTYCMQVAQMNQQEAVAKEFTDKLNAISSGL